MDKKNGSKNNPLLMTIVVSLIVGALGFLGGMQYQKSQRVNMFQVGNGQGRQVFRGGSGTQGIGRGGNGQGARPITGEIISSDEKSVTVKMQDGSTKIIILSADTKINKSSEASKTDLTAGQQVMAFGSENSDGSMTAQNISLGMGIFGGMRGNGNATPNQSPAPTK